MSSNENRTELWRTANAAIDRAAGDLHDLQSQLAERGSRSRLQALGDFTGASGLDPKWAAGGVEDAFVAGLQHFNAEDMRKGLQHGHVAVALTADTACGGDIVASFAATLGLAAVLEPAYGRVSLIAVERESDLLRLCDAGLFSAPDCVFSFHGSKDGHGFQHSTSTTGVRLAGVSVEISVDGGPPPASFDTQALAATFDRALSAQESVRATATGVELRASESTRVHELLDLLLEHTREAAAASGVEITVESGPVLPELLPSRILARRIKTCAESLNMPLDPLRRVAPGEPTPWGRVSHDVAIAVAGYPLGVGEANELEAALQIARAVAGAGLDVLGDMEFRSFVDGERVRALRERGLERTPRRWLGVHPVLPPEDGQRRSVRVPDVIVRGPGIPEPTLEDLVDDDPA